MASDARPRRASRETPRGWMMRLVSFAFVAIALCSTIARGAAVGFSVDRATLLEERFERDAGGFFSLARRDDAFADATKHNALVYMERGRLLSARAVTSGGGAFGTDGFVVETNATSSAVSSGDYVEVTVRRTSGSPPPNASFANHFIAAYSPAGADVTKTAPVKYAVLNFATAGEYARTGRATVRFQTLTHREETYDFVLFAPSAPSVDSYHMQVPAWAVARSASVTLMDPLAPSWPRVTLPPSWSGIGSDKNGASVRVTWQSGRNATHGAKLKYRVVGGDSRYVHVPASTTTYQQKDMCDEPATGFGFRHAGYIHTADVTGVHAGDIIEYYVHDHHDTSDRFEMRIPPAQGPDAEVTLGLYADMGRGSTDDAMTWHSYGEPALNVSRALEKDAREGKIDAIFHFGDLSYAKGYASVWDDWAAQIVGFASRVPFLTNQGNHELDTPADKWLANRSPDLFGVDDSGGECGVPATRLYPTPRVSPDEDWWAVTLGSIRVVSMNTEIDFSTDSAQFAWLENELQRIDRSVTPWVILGGHRPGVIDSTDGPDNRPTPPAGKLNPSDLTVMAELQRYVWPLLVKYDVTLAFWGHNHAYQRSCVWESIGAVNEHDGCVAHSVVDADGVAVYVEPTAPVSVVAGTAGAELTVNGVGHDFTEKSLYDFGYVRLTAKNRTHLYGEFQQAGSGYGDILDKFMIIQKDTAADQGTNLLLDELSRALTQVQTWRSMTYVMAVFTCVTLAMGAGVVARQWRADARKHRFHILEFDDEL